MQVALICEKCAKVHTEDTDGANLVLDFQKKEMFFLCMNKKCKHENHFDFGNWHEQSKKSPLPPTRIM
jgi:hypothetical protein